METSTTSTHVPPAPRNIHFDALWFVTIGTFKKAMDSFKDHMKEMLTAFEQGHGRDAAGPSQGHPIEPGKT
ncbi:hypothetical protein CTI12_AA197560 [Artemisia annua]|uniref:Uncharacterized protein n=1 Tax=Artemisia annua TaxID=35608 RepID=A0A2U1P3U8_ARTAN|nr:hypothetical protein CTI12_AA197560 [Artemisia annua]